MAPARTALAALVACAALVAGAAAALARPAPPPATRVIGLRLSGYGAHLVPPTSPTLKPYSTDCHKLVDPAFTGVCAVASSAAGTVAGVVEVERGAFGGQERDVVWRKQGHHWSLALVHVTANPRSTTLLWRYDLRPGRQELVFVLPAAVPGFGSELDVVEGNGQVSLYRFLGAGFADVPLRGNLVTYVPESYEAKLAGSYFDQTLITWLGGSWRVIAEQYVPYPAALAQHKGAFWAPGAVPAS